MKKGWLLDTALGILLTALAAACYLQPQNLPFVENLELKSFDSRSKLRQNIVPSSDIVLIAIDDSSIAQLGRWPWPRSRVAALLDKLAPAKPRVIGLDIVFSEPEANQGLVELQAIAGEFAKLKTERKLVDKTNAFEGKFSEAMVRLDSDAKLLASLKTSGTLVLPMFFADGVRGAKVEPLPPFLETSLLEQKGAYQAPPDADLPPRAVPPVEAFASAASAVGHVNVEHDLDGSVRRTRPAIYHAGRWMPSFAVQLVLAGAGVKPNEASFEPGKVIKFGGSTIPLDLDGELLITYSLPGESFKTASFYDVLNDKVSLDLFKDKIVIIGPTALAVGTNYVTPVAPSVSSVELMAHVAQDILQGRFLTRPEWAWKAELGLLAFVGLFITFILPRLKALWGFLVSFMLLLAVMGAGTYEFVNGHWLKVAYGATLLCAGYLLVISKRFFLTEKGKELVEASAIETNKMLGLSFQGQGMLDMAFEKFRLCPLDDSMKENLYNLGLDFERKRQFAKAASVLEHISAKDPKYKDIADKIKTLKAASDGAVFGAIGGGAAKGGTVMIAGGAAKPTLGRYEIEKELGRGAMGVVYLGKDPKINRQVAIKTMMLEEGSDAAEAKAVKERFFREAESAGTLNHPNIVRIFDAGEENDVAYIAMELLDGQDLVRFTSKDGMLPLATALEYVATVAEALDYAHEKGIVHRDVKPANVMLLKDGTLRVADFGIARITASSKTATGTVMGTPSYMSPEQVAGKKVDGRSDLFSLGVMLYELVTGEKPWKGGEGIGTLLFQIANDPHPDPLSIKPDLPAGVKAVIDKVLSKSPDARYARGSALAADLRSALTAKAAPPPAPEFVPAAAPAAPAPAATAPAAPAPIPEPVTMPIPKFELPAAPAPKPEATMPSMPKFEIPAMPAPVPVAPAADLDKTLVASLEIELGAPPGPKLEEKPKVEDKTAPNGLPPLRTMEFPAVDLNPAPAASNPDATIRLSPPKEPS